MSTQLIMVIIFFPAISPQIHSRASVTRSTRRRVSLPSHAALPKHHKTQRFGNTNCYHNCSCGAIIRVAINTRNMRSLPLDICLGPMICVTLDLGLPNGVDLITHERIISSRQLCSRRSAALGIRGIILTRISRPITSLIERPARRRALPLAEPSVLSRRDS